uniref:Tribbles 1 n=1 Tax=Sphaerodactylus townsendi TaxID=933632 RepID=A0ACB8FDV4_9SAUR
MSRPLDPRSPAALLLPPAAAAPRRAPPAKRLLLQDAPAPAAAEDAPPAAKGARLSLECSGAAAPPPDCLSAPASPCAPLGTPRSSGGGGGGGAQGGPSLVSGYLLLPLPEREHVWLALDIHAGRELRCKVFPLKHYQDKIRPYIQLPSHRNITGIVEVILGDTKAYVFFDKDFGDMHSYLRSCKRLPEQQAARLFKQIVSAVAHCHQSAIVLGDLKLRKFVFSSEERLLREWHVFWQKLCELKFSVKELLTFYNFWNTDIRFAPIKDCTVMATVDLFTFVTTINGDETQLRLESLEDTHIIKGEDDALSDKHGCPAYVSPEILNTTGTYSGKSADVWSLGVMLYTLLVGRYPFHDSDPSALFSKIRRGQFCIPEHVSPKARCLIRSLLRRDPSERLSAPEILLHPWFDAVLESGYVDQDTGAFDQIVPENSRVDDDISSFFC